MDPVVTGDCGGWFVTLPGKFPHLGHSCGSCCDWRLWGLICDTTWGSFLILDLHVDPVVTGDCGGWFVTLPGEVSSSWTCMWILL